MGACPQIVNRSMGPKPAGTVPRLPVPPEQVQVLGLGTILGTIGGVYTSYFVVRERF